MVTRGAATIDRVLRDSVAVLANAGIESPQLDAELIIAGILDTDRVGLRIRSATLVSEGELATISSAILRRADNEPVAYILGHAAFRTVELAVDARVLVPRPETELLVDCALDFARKQPTQRPLRILDVGTGSGAIIVAIGVELRAISYDTKLFASDISQDALDVAQANAGHHGVDVAFRLGDMLSPFSGESFDVILSNPPYINREDESALPPDVQKYEPHAALFGPEHDTIHHYRQLAEHGRAALRHDGIIAVEVGYGQAGAIAELFATANYRHISVLDDLQGIGRVVSARAPLDADVTMGGVS